MNSQQPAIPTTNALVEAAPRMATKSSSAPGFLDFLRSLRRRLVLALMLGLFLGGGFAAAVWLGMPTKTTVSVILHVASSEQRVLPADGVGRTEFQIYQQTQAALVKSRMVLNAALKKEAVASLGVLPTEPDQQYEWLQRELKVDFKAGPEFMRVSLEGHRPADLKVVLNALTQAFLQEVVHKESTLRKAKLAKLQEIQASYETKLHNRRKDVRRLVEAVGSGDPLVIAVKQKFVLESLGMVEKELIQTQSERMRAELDLKNKQSRIKTVGTSISDAETRRELEKDPALTALNQKLELVNQEIAELEQVATRGSDEPVVRRHYAKKKGVEAEIVARHQQLLPKVRERLREQAEGEVAHQTETLRERKAYLDDYEKSLEKRLESLRKQTQSTTVRQADLEEFKLQIAHEEKIADRVTAEAEAMKVERDAPNRVTLLEDAVASTLLTEQRRIKAAAGAGLLGLCLALGWVGWREFSLHRVNSTNDSVKYLGMPVLGGLPTLTPPSRRSSRSEPRGEAWQAMVLEHVDVVRTNLLHRAQNENVRVILVSSAVPGEGKTSLACQIAASLARAGHRTILLDGDMRRPSAHKLLNLPQGPGLSELLRLESFLGETIYPTVIDGLYLIPAGVWDHQAAQGLSRKQLPDILTRLKEQFDYVIIDSAPILPVVDSLVLAQHVDGVVLSLLCEVSRMPLVREACQRLTGVGANILGVILNGTPSNTQTYPYGYVPRGTAEKAATEVVEVVARSSTVVQA